MTATQHYFISLLKASLFDTKPPTPTDEIDWDYLLGKAVEQNVSGLLANVILQLPEDFTPYNAELWEKEMLKTMYAMGKRFAEFDRMAEIFVNEGIRPIALKGIVLKDLYPVPELRTMGDFDILADDMHLIGNILKKEGYNIFFDGVCVSADRNKIHWEIFESLESEFKINTDKYDNLMKNNTLDWGNIRRSIDTYFAAHVIIHAAKHILGTGAGVRQLCDCILTLKYMEVDMKMLREFCIEQHAEKVLDYIIACGARDFGLKTEYDTKLDTELFWEYLLANGVFGKQIPGNTMLFQTGRGDSSVPQWRKMYFPPQELLSIQYSYAKKHKILLPVAWVHRFINAFFIRRDSVTVIAKGIKDAKSFGDEREQWLKKLELH